MASLWIFLLRFLLIGASCPWSWWIKWILLAGPFNDRAIHGPPWHACILPDPLSTLSASLENGMEFSKVLNEFVFQSLFYSSSSSWMGVMNDLKRNGILGSKRVGQRIIISCFHCQWLRLSLNWIKYLKNCLEQKQSTNRLVLNRRPQT